MNKLPISVIVLTFNEELNIKDCLESICDWVEEIFIVDSYSTDTTLEIAKNFKVKIFENEFKNYSQQRNWSLKNLPIETEWILNLDADHRVSPELKKELNDIFSSYNLNSINGFLISRKTIFMKKWIKYGGHFPSYHSILFRKNCGYCEEKLYDQHFVVEGKKIKLKGTVIDIVTDSLNKFIDRHNKWSSFESEEYCNQSYHTKNSINVKFLGNSIERKRYLKNYYYNFPLFFRPFLYFFYRYFLRFGFLDGKEGLIFHFLQGFWFRFLIDAKIYELKKHKN